MRGALRRVDIETLILNIPTFKAKEALNAMTATR
jgi:hypothetical protein